MTQYLFADEAGCFTFENKPNVSKFFILCTITMTTIDVGHALQNLRHALLLKGHALGDYFHATEDKQAVRDGVFAEILKHDFHVQATILEKRKAQPRVRASKARFYKYPWYYHFKHGLSKHLDGQDNLIVVAAAIGNRREKLSFNSSITDAIQQSVRDGNWLVDFRPSAADPCLQVADYCAWAIQRKWERNDRASFDLISDRVSYEYELWKRGTTYYY
jgi:hypothetical protein